MKKITLFFVSLFCMFSILRSQTYNATVAKDGSGTHTTVSGAIMSAPTNSTTPYYIFVKNGVYNEKDTVPTNRPNIIMVGENVLNTVIYYNDNANTLFNGSPIGTSGSACFFVNGANFNAFNITFQNNSGVAAGQAVAVNISGNRAAFRNCRFLGFQDVLYCKNSGIVSYFYNCYIEGTVDFIFGASTSWFENCYLYCKNRNSGGVITAPNTAAGTSFGSPWGFVFNNCSVNGASNMTGQYFLGRPWQNKPQAVFLNTSMSDVVNAAGWSNNSAGSASTADVSFGEFNNSGVGANGGVRSSAFATMLTSTQAANYTLSNVLGSWDPCSIANVCNPLDLPVATANFLGSQNSISSSSFSWNMCWPLSMNYTLKRSNNGGSFTSISSISGSSNTYNYTTNDNSMPNGINRYILEMTFNGVTYTSTDTITISNQPTITPSVLTLPAFTQTTGSPSFLQSFTVSGSNLTDNVTVTAPSNFQVSSNGVTWVNSFTLNQSSGSISSALVYVRLNAGGVGTYNGNVSLSTTGGSTVNVSVSGTTSNAPAYVANVIQEFLHTSNSNDNPTNRAVGINASTQTFNRLFVSDGTTVASVPAYSNAIGMGFGPSLTTTSNGLWTAANGGPGSTLSRLNYIQYTISGQTGYSVRVDSILFSSAIWNSSNGRLGIVYSKSNFVSDSANVTSGGTLNGTTLSGTAFGAFTSPIIPANSTAVGGYTGVHRIPLNGSTGVILASGETLTVRLYYAVGSSSAGRFGQIKNVQFKGSVTAPPPTISSFTPTSQVSGGSVVINGTNFSGVTSVTFGNTPATSFTVNSGTQITAVVAAGTSGSVSVTTASGTATLSGFTFQTPTTYYNVANTDVTDINNWGTNTDGSGTKPNNFTDDLQTFRIFNSGATMSQAWVVSGTNSKISINFNSGSFAVTQTITGIVDVETDADIQIKTATAPVFGTIAAGSTVGYSAIGVDQTITSANYSNLTLNGTGARTFPNSAVGIANQFTTNNYTSANVGSIINFNGSSPQTLPSFTFDSLVINNTNGCFTQGGGSNITVNKGCNILQNLTISAGDNWVMAGSNGVSFNVASGRTLTVNGVLDNQSTGVATWGTLNSSSSSSTAANGDSLRFVVNSGGVYKINAAVTNSYFIAVGNYNSGSEIQILQGAPRIPFYIGGSLTWNTTAIGTASFVQQASNTINGNFNIINGQFNNGTGGTARAVTVNGNLNISGGEYDVNGNISGTSSNQTLTVNGNVNVSGGKLYPTISTNGGSGTISINGNLSISGTGNFANAPGTLIGNNVVLQGTMPKTSSAISGNMLNLTINNAAGVTFSGNVNTTNLTLTNGLALFGNNVMNVGGNVTRTNGWVVGVLSKSVSTGTNVSRSFEIGDLTNYLPVALTFANVTNAGSVSTSINSPISAVNNFNSVFVSPIDYINRYWNMQALNGLAFSNCSISINYLATDLVGNATSNSVIAFINNNTWNQQTTASTGLTSNTIINVTALGNIVVGNDCTPVTPTITISTASNSVCSNNSVTFTSNATNPGTAPMYQWKKNGVSVGNGTTINFPANSLISGDVITCDLVANNTCQTTANASSNAIVMTILSNPSLAPLTINSTNGGVVSSLTLCDYTSLTNIYCATPGGTWSSSNPSVATFINGSVGIRVSGVSNGTATISYSITASNGCASSSNVSVIVNRQTPAVISGSNTICLGNTNTYTTTSVGGVWGTRGLATINNSGVATPTSSGSTAITYTLTNENGCVGVGMLPVTINTRPAIPNIAYASGSANPKAGAPAGFFCANRNFNLVGFPSGGTWSSTGVISINPTTGAASTSNIAGAGSIIYTVTNANGCSNSRTIGGVTTVSCASRGANANLSSVSISNNFKMYPNPSKGIVILQLEKLVGEAQVTITDILGKQVMVKPLSMGNNTLEISNLSKGMYLVNVVTAEGKQTQKLIKE